MAKNVSLSDDVYETLFLLKKKNESFSDVIRRLLPPKGMLHDLAGRKTFSYEEWETVSKAFQTQQSHDNERKKQLLGMKS